MDTQKYEAFIRNRIAELRLKKNVSEHQMSLDLDKSGSYIRGITNGLSMPSARGLLWIIQYFNMTPSEFFAPLRPAETKLERLYERLYDMDEASLDKLIAMLDLLGW